MLHSTSTRPETDRCSNHLGWWTDTRAGIDDEDTAPSSAAGMAAKFESVPMLGDGTTVDSNLNGVDGNGLVESRDGRPHTRSTFIFRGLMNKRPDNYIQ